MRAMSSGGNSSSRIDQATLPAPGGRHRTPSPRVASAGYRAPIWLLRAMNAVLFGVDSFWHGVDVQGETLSNVIITKLPFAVPDDPITEARMEAITAEGGNAFLNYQLPLAVIKLKQGFGRLIRSRRDHGLVVLLDPRVLTKRYGQAFLQALPDCRRFIDGVLVEGSQRRWGLKTPS